MALALLCLATLAEGWHRVLASPPKACYAEANEPPVHGSIENGRPQLVQAA